jgi:hypothetical protein
MGSIGKIPENDVKLNGPLLLLPLKAKDVFEKLLLRD